MSEIPASMAAARKALNALGGYGRDATYAQREVDARTIAQFILEERGQTKQTVVEAQLLDMTKPTHRHKKRGGTYTLIGVGKMQAEHWIDQRWHRDPNSDEPPKSTWSLVDMREVAIYRSCDDDSIWVRPIEEFNDGRFEPISGEA